MPTWLSSGCAIERFDYSSFKLVCILRRFAHLTIPKLVRTPYQCQMDAAVAAASRLQMRLQDVGDHSQVRA